MKHLVRFLHQGYDLLLAVSAWATVHLFSLEDRSKRLQHVQSKECSLDATFVVGAGASCIFSDGADESGESLLLMVLVRNKSKLIRFILF